MAEVCFGRFIADNAILNERSIFNFLLADKNRFKGMIVSGSRNEYLKSYYHYVVTEPSRLQLLLIKTIMLHISVFFPNSETLITPEHLWQCLRMKGK